MCAWLCGAPQLGTAATLDTCGTGTSSYLERTGGRRRWQRRRRRRRRRHPRGRARCSRAQPAAHRTRPARRTAAPRTVLGAPPQPAPCGGGVGRPDRGRARATEGLEQRLAYPRLGGASAPVGPRRRALAVRAPAGLASPGSSSAGRRGGRSGSARGRGARARADGSARLFSSPAARRQPEPGSRDARVVTLVAHLGGAHRRLRAATSAANESPRWSGRAAGSRWTAQRLGGRQSRTFFESPSMRHHASESL